MYTQAQPRWLDRTRLVLVALTIALAAAAGVAQLGDGGSVSGSMPVPGSDANDTIVGASTGMPVPGLDGVVERVVESGN